MKLFLQYTLDNIRRNKRTSCSILAAVFLSSLLLCTTCIYAYSLYHWRSDLEVLKNGSWHAELGGEVTAENLSFLDHHLEVEKSMIKGAYTIVKLPSNSPLPYLLLRNADKNYWEEMGEKSYIIEGHTPEKPGEIVVAKTFFLKNPQYQIGDTITFPTGKRIDGNTILDVESYRETEFFQEDGNITLTLVGILDVTTTTITPGYYAMGYLDRSMIQKEDEFVVYLKMKDIHKTYQIMPQIADALGFSKNEYGAYENHFSYHTVLLALNLTFPSEDMFSLNHLSELFPVILIIILILFITCAFIFIIQNVFSISAQRKITQFGMFRSIGAAPSQIYFSLLLECLLLSIFPILLGVIAGYFFTKFTLQIYTQQLGELIEYPISVQCSPLIILSALLLCFIMVWISAWIPAYRAARMSPIEAIRGKQLSIRRKKRAKTGWLFLCFGIEGNLASASYYANRKAFRSSISALFFCLLLATGFSCLVEVSNFNSNRNNHAKIYNIDGRIQMLTPLAPDIIEEILQIEGIEDMIWYCQANAAYWASEKEQSPEFTEHGGFSKINKPERYHLSKQDGKWRIPVYLFGIADSCFDVYCYEQNLSPEIFYNQNKKQNTLSVIACSSASLYPFSNNPEKAVQTCPLLSLNTGQKLQLDEKTRDSMETDYQFTVSIASVTTTMPTLNLYYAGDYSIRLYMPLSVYYPIVASFLPDSAARTHRLYIELKTLPEKDLQITKELRQILSAWFAEEDIYIISSAEEKRDDAIRTLAMETIIWCISVLLALIGISAAFLTVTSSMQQRRREYAMLRSIGMDSHGVQKMLFLEGIRLAITPICMILPILFLILSWLFSINEITWKEFLPYFPFTKLIVSIVLEVIAVVSAYWISSKQIRHDTILEIIREDTV